MLLHQRDFIRQKMLTVAQTSIIHNSLLLVDEMHKTNISQTT